MKHNIVLIGFMGSGKSSVGELLAKRLSYKFCDSDRLIENKAGKAISRIFDSYGEEYFRDLESKLLEEMKTSLDYAVLSTGGGMPLREKNMQLLRELGYVVYLKASKKTTIKRLRGDRTRPLLKGEDFEQRVDRLLTVRIPIYEKAAHKIIETDDKTVKEIVAEIIKEWTAIAGKED